MCTNSSSSSNSSYVHSVKKFCIITGFFYLVDLPVKKSIILSKLEKKKDIYI